MPIKLGQSVNIPENVEEIRMTYVGSLAIPHIHMSDIIDVINERLMPGDADVTRNDIASIKMTVWLNFEVTLKDGRTFESISDLVCEDALREALDHKRGFEMSHWVTEDGSIEEIEQPASE